MLTLTLLLTADTTRAAKVSLLNFPQQALLEMLIDDLEPKSLFQKWSLPWQDPEFQEITEWSGVTCMSTGEVHAIDWTLRKLTGRLALKYLPRTVENFIVCRNKISGSVGMKDLPASLRTLQMQENELSGSIDLTVLPNALSTLILSNNLLSGTLDFTQLPASMRMIYLDHNKFSGKINLQRLPQLLTDLSASYNEISGEVNLREVKLHYLGLRNNAINVVYMGSRFFECDVHLYTNPKLEIRHLPDFWRPPRLHVDADTKFVCVPDVAEGEDEAVSE